MGIISDRLKELGIELPLPGAPAALYIPAVTVNNLVYTSGNDCRINGKLIFEGKLGKDLTIEQGQQAARQTMINLLGVLQAHLGDLDRVEKIVKLLAFVNSAEGFTDQPYVINGASELLQTLFGEEGRHARSAIGTSELPFNTPVEIEMIVQIKA
ncbi:Enamine deaminase RidA, house cleaning of reactive enamine intermediates, YjgF/YER057c/UK114 family [Paenibacillus sp. 1_12]|uniref:RidA family protein n=1 Tax=Paenibacillus sp. 1_12 TaxID=1566278 RepID=UPI0008E0D5CC|nr:RidA family protein [Paenibacillus sp. 1_12]SFL67807.1 Enamine deaminase RidA, house cleaning of reactive enamine intermediates, YjgF/YER057c/UK114 family [Paenibacillus sp. 1_12]